MRKGTKKLFPDDWDGFINAVNQGAEMDKFPMSLQLRDINNVKLTDIQDLFNDFEQTTGYEMTAYMFRCFDCGKLHFTIGIDYPDEDENIPIQ